MRRDEFYRWIDERLTADPARVHQIDDAIWGEAGRTRAILVTDMSGFTRLTKQHGILEFLTLFRRAVRAAEPLFRANGACAWKTAADNMMATFEGPAAAVAVARELARLDLGASRLCLGIGYGRVLDLDDDFFGDEVNVAYKLGEDLATAGEVLVSEAASRELDGAHLEGPLAHEVGGVTLKYHRLKL